ncbi:hypothetical protein [Bradyrhizobium japonicum]|uniref:hypothetical protein n=1 Tax=Bradyrhizobium japonicum TaxID=375 RepID=UPI00209D3992|nr:hypothetical protein [Bradyrhizobium japonicum]MCP1768655.1 hypothetical protein [Bradyrhizobium japonicum]MCP1794325.1 hypothetical protein [Bradyrhizobium japonicum]MCP1810919.1 hypothetical protein [Bradyrhizobium japonicum]MCP1821228.1 hypothetical protein [Bradyrhizobium japonicum]MCP1876264.1 hypothetical protein [Bradyrhizobium japonicum]
MGTTDNDEVYILRCKEGKPEDEAVCIGLLQEKRSDAGELIEMFIEPFEGVLDHLVGDNLLYFEKIDARLYRYSRFEQYPDFEEIVAEPVETSDGQKELRAVLKEAEETISLVRQGRPIQKIDPTRTSGPKIENLTRPTRLGFGLRRK